MTVLTKLKTTISRLLCYLGFAGKHDKVGAVNETTTNKKREKPMGLIDYEDVIDGEMILHFSLGFIDSYSQELYEQDLPESEIKELVQKEVAKFINTVSDTFDGNMDKKVLYMKLDSYYGQHSSDNFDQVSGFLFDDLGYDNMFVRLTKVYEADDVDALCLSIADFGRFGISVVNWNNELIYQGYSDGEYDTGAFSHHQDYELYLNKGWAAFNYAEAKLSGSEDDDANIPRIISNLDDYKRFYPENYVGESWEDFEKLLSAFRMLDPDRINIQHSKSTVCTVTLDKKAIFGFNKSGYTTLLFGGYPLSKSAFESICEDIHKMGFTTNLGKDGKWINIKGSKEFKEFLALLSLTLRYINAR